MIFLIIILIAIAAAAITFELSASLAVPFIKIKPVLLLLSSIKVYKQILGQYLILLSPVLVPLFIASTGILLLVSILECKYCFAFWFGLGLALLFNFPVLVALCIGGLSIMMQTINNLIKIKSF